MTDVSLNQAQQQIILRILNADKTIFKGSVNSVSSENKKGKFDILPNHSHFIAVVNKQISFFTDKSHQEKFPIKSGVLRCWNNEVDVYIVS